MRIIFIDGTPTEYDGASARSLPLGGMEGATFELSRALAARGHRVSVANACRTPRRQIDGVDWYPRSLAADLSADRVIANNDPSLFSLATAAMRDGARPVIWQHNDMRIEKLLRKGEMRHLLHYRPGLVASGRYQMRRISRVLPLRPRRIIPLGVGEPFIGAETSGLPPPRRAVYTSQPYRGFKDCVRLWIKSVRPVVPDAELVAFVGTTADSGFSDAELAANGIIRRERVDKRTLVRELQSARMLLYPGHASETFCLAAAEALCAGTPVVTQGIGALSERVRHQVDGIIEPRSGSLVRAVVALLRDDELWRRLHRAALENRNTLSWSPVAECWDDFLARDVG